MIVCCNLTYTCRTMLKAIKPQTYDEAMARLFLEGRRDGYVKDRPPEHVLTRCSEDKKKLLYGLVSCHAVQLNRADSWIRCRAMVLSRSTTSSPKRAKV